MKRYEMAIVDRETVDGEVYRFVEPYETLSGKWVRYSEIKDKNIGEYTVTIKADTGQVEKELDRLVTMAIDLETRLDMIADRLRRRGD